jgi:hypothetical protein
MTLLLIEVRRSLRRRVVWSLVAVALVGIAVFAVVAFVSSGHLDVARLRAEGGDHPAVLVDWWVPGGGDSVLMIAAFFLLMGGLIGGASVVGGEWRSGNVATLLLWEPRRLRLFLARVGATFACATVIAAALQLLLLAALLPAVLLHGTTAGATASWWMGLAAAIARLSLATGLTTAVAACLAFVSRTAAGAIIALWAWLALVETLLRIHVIGSHPYLLSENITRVITWAELRETGPSRSPMSAAVLLACYAVGIAAVSAWSFGRRDVVVD